MSKNLNKRSNKRSNNRSNKRSGAEPRKRSKHSRNEYNVPNKMKLYYDLTLKELSTNKAFLDVDKDKSMIHGKATKAELLKMPWMFGVNAIWSSVPEPYVFELSFTQKDKGEIQKRLSIHNGNAYLLKNIKLNV